MKAVAALLLLLSCLFYCHGWTCTAPPQQPSAAQIDAGQGQVVMTDSSSNAYFLSGSGWSKLGTVPLIHVTAGPAGIWGVDSSNNIYKFVGGDFVSVDGLLQQVDAGGNEQEVGVNSADKIFCLKSSITLAYPQPGPVAWTPFDGLLTYFSCGPNRCWGVNSADNIYVSNVNPSTCSKTRWTQVPGAAKMAEVGTDGSVFVVSSNGDVFQRTGITSSLPQGRDWVQIPFCLPVKHVSYDLGHLWVVFEIGLILDCQQ
ncbi:fish-egg lectin [Nothobranchius furzeri]|uniref:fish-egg lectin n=1 Tax=Nothobranchius furzeri TaxID=105023 RepID=UPI0039047F64